MEGKMMLLKFLLVLTFCQVLLAANSTREEVKAASPESDSVNSRDSGSSESTAVDETVQDRNLGDGDEDDEEDDDEAENEAGKAIDNPEDDDDDIDDEKVDLTQNGKPLNPNLTGRTKYGGKKKKALLPYYPYQVAVLRRGRPKCGGSIISKNFVLTAAHCVRKRPRQYSIRAGSSLSNRGGKVIPVSRIQIHPKYNKKTRNFDVAILQLQRNLRFSETILPIRLGDEGDRLPQGLEGTFVGWKRGLLSVVNLPLVGRNSCKSKYGSQRRKTITETMTCAGEYSQRITPLRDTGGPLVIGVKQVGVATYYGESQNPSVFTTIRMVRDFIRQVTRI